MTPRLPLWTLALTLPSCTSLETWGLGGQEGEDFGDADTDSDTDKETDKDTGLDSGEVPTISACDETSTVVRTLRPPDTNAMSSPVLARVAARSGWNTLYGVPIRTSEFLNYYSFDYPSADDGALGIAAALVPDPSGAPNAYVLQLGVSTEHRDNDERAPLNLTFAVDTSTSMAGTPLRLVQEAMTQIAAGLKRGDVVSVLSWDTAQGVLVDGLEVDGPSDSDLLSAINALVAGGGADVTGGLSAGYGVALRNWRTGSLNRVVVFSDGQSSAGLVSVDLISGHAGGQDTDGIYVVGVGVGSLGRYNGALMDQVTDAGKGASVFLDSEAEAARVFGERFVNTFDVAARNVSVRLQMPPGFEIRELEGETPSEARLDPQHLAPNDALVLHEELTTCAPDSLTDDSVFEVTVRWQDAVTFEAQELTRAWTFAELRQQDPALLYKGRAITRYAEALEVYGDDARWPDARNEASAALFTAQVTNPGDADLAEVEAVLDALR